jgi:hypothetical protein
MPDSSDSLESRVACFRAGSNLLTQLRESPSADRNGRSIVEIPLDEIEDSPFQVKLYDDTRVKELADSIRHQGLLQPWKHLPPDGGHSSPPLSTSASGAVKHWAYVRRRGPEP